MKQNKELTSYHKIDFNSVKTVDNPDWEGAILPFSSHLKHMIKLPVWWF